ncbi:MAG: 2,3-bisphosphoglycerate-independent phosphoglycerate mutase [Nitrospiraceae bacterium]|nr:2,3-bisphosphoglycerate-independent phosphoglycerate mutase [Nitrospiraceae bacterium]
MNPERKGNAILNANTPNYDRLMKFCPNTLLQAAGIAVGLNWNEVGNSEVGHTTIGAGKVLYQNLPRVNLAIKDGSFFENKAILETINKAKETNADLHLMGLLSDGGVHGHLNHLYALLELTKRQKFDPEKVFIHIFTDGRDTGQTEGVKFVSELLENIKSGEAIGRIASIVGRYYAMDRNNNWERTKIAYGGMVNGEGEKTSDPISAMKKSYQNGVTDEFIKPIVVLDEQDKLHRVNFSDSMIFYNIREDRARQITKAFVMPDFDKFERKFVLPKIQFCAMMEYEKDLPMNVAFLPEKVSCPLGKAISDAKFNQLRIAETEKYAHVTYFFNGGREEPFKNEYRTLIPSPSVASYDEVPEMSAAEITNEAIKAVESGKFSFILINYANSDMIGHTGNFKAAIQAIEFVDLCLGKLCETTLNSHSVLLITADHGNSEEMIDPLTGKILTTHTSNPVPFILVDPENKPLENGGASVKIEGMLSDIAPTVLELLEIPKPEEMTGRSLMGVLS